MKYGLPFDFVAISGDFGASIVYVLGIILENFITIEILMQIFAMLYTLEDIKDITIDLKLWNKVFLYGDLWSWKTTLVQSLLSRFFMIEEKVKSPTYIHYKKYPQNIYHFDLYRLEDYEEFVNIWWEEILENPDNTCLIEWPEIIDDRFVADIKIYLSKVNWSDSSREVRISYNESAQSRL